MLAASIAWVALELAVASTVPQSPGDGDPVKLHADLQYADGFAREPRRNRLDLYLPSTNLRSKRAAPPLVMFVHGGSWVGGRKEQFEFLGRALAERDVACAAINMQLFPFARPDAMVADCGRALAYLHQRAVDFGYDAERLFVMGHSSGAHLAAWLALDQQQLDAAGVPNAAVRGAILLSGVYELRAHHPALEIVFGGDRELRVAATPLLAVDRADPSVFVAWAERDLPCFSLCGRALRDRLRANGVRVVAQELTGKNHVDYLFQLGRRRDAVLPRIVRFVRGESRDSGDSSDSSQSALSAPLATAVVWMVGDESERAVARALGGALAPVGVELIPCDADDVDSATAGYRRLRAERVAAGRLEPTFVGGFAHGGLLAAQARVSRGDDGLDGRVLIAAKLEQERSEFEWLYADRVPSRVLVMHGQRDAESIRSAAEQLARRLQRRHVIVHPIELDRTTASAAMLGLSTDDDLIVPLLRAFLLR